MITIISNSDLINKNYRNEEPASQLTLTKDQYVVDRMGTINRITGGNSVADSQSALLVRKENERNSRDVLPRSDRTGRGESGSVRDTIYQRAVQEWSQEDAEALVWIIDRESGFNQYAQNKNCIGIAQRYYPNFTAEEREAYLNDLPGQVDDLFSYIRGRYGDGIRAKIWWQSHSWY